MSADMVDIDGQISLPSSEIHIWLTNYEESDEGFHAAYRELLNPAEQEREKRFYFARDQRRYLLTRALVRTVLSRYASIRPAEWLFSTNPYGRPIIANAEARDAGLSFNISHTHSLIVVGVTRSRALGVDVENVHRREVSIDIANNYFAKPEVADLIEVPRQLQQYRFFEYWTFKEAYIKARGMGLSLPLDKFSFRYPDDHAVEIAIDRDLGDDSARWQFWQLRPARQYVLAVCAERAGTLPARLITRWAIPLDSEAECVVEVQRVSKTAVHHKYNRGKDDCFCVSWPGFAKTWHGSRLVR